MFYKMIENACNMWYSSPKCTVNSIIDYIRSKGKMRDAQVEAIKTYLYLKIACGGAPLVDLFQSGMFNTLDLDNVELSNPVHLYLQNNSAAAALFEYACLKNEDNEQVSEALENQ